MSKAARKNEPTRRADILSLEPRRLFAFGYTAAFLQPAAQTGIADLEGGVALSDTFTAGNLSYGSALRSYVRGGDDPTPVILQPLAGDDSTVVSGVNLDGRVVGASFAADDNSSGGNSGGNSSGVGSIGIGMTGGGSVNLDDAHAAVWNAATGRVSDLGPGVATAVSPGGAVIGNFDDQAVQYVRGGPRAIPDLGGSASSAADINGRGVIVGTSNLADDSASVPFIYDGRRAYSILPGQAAASAAIGHASNQTANVAAPALGQGNAINDAGVAVGSSTAGAFVYHAGVSSILPTPAEITAVLSSTATDINNHGEIVGSVSGDFGSHAVLWSADNTPTDLNTLLSDHTINLTSAASINDSGQILAYGQHGLFTSTYVLTPVRAVLGSTGTLNIAGTDGDDAIAVSIRNNKYRVSVNALVSNFVASRVKRIFISGQDGADDIEIAPNVTRTATVDAGDGDDIVSGGGGNDVLIGGNGDDLLLGNAGADTLNGGDGHDETDHDPNDLLINILHLPPIQVLPPGTYSPAAPPTATVPMDNLPGGLSPISASSLSIFT